MIRALRADEPLPDGAPRRYRNGAGYIRLRWKVGVEEYVEEYEHRVVMGRPAGMEVHHLDGDKAHNDPSNLIVLTPEAHAELHIALARAAGKFRGRARDRERAARRIALETVWAERASMYEQGTSTPEIGRLVGLDGSNIYRGLKRRGVQMRGAAEGTRIAKQKERHAA